MTAPLPAETSHALTAIPRMAVSPLGTGSQMSTSRVLAAYLGDIAFELRKMLRTPVFAVPTLLFPAMFYLLFGVLMGSGRGDGKMAQYLFAAYGVFGTMAPGLFGFGVSLAFERELGTMTFRQALPTPPGSYLLARMVMAMIFVSIIVAMLTALAIFVSHVPLTAGQIATVFVVDVLGVLPFCALGMFVGALVSGQAAPAIINLIYLPMAFLSGLWVPFQYLPHTVQQIAPLWPAFHLTQLSLAALDMPSLGSVARHIGALAGVTVLFFWLAMRRLGSRGVRLLGPARAGLGFPMRRVAGIATVSIAIGLIVAGYVGGAAKVTAPPAATSDTASGSSAAAATAADQSGAPGVAVPAAPLVADFENGTPAAKYGLGWAASSDAVMGGNSTAAIRVAEGGAGGSRHSIEITGTLSSGSPYPFAGMSFLPAGKPDVQYPDQPLADFSGKRSLHFQVRGDGREYVVMILGAQAGAMPAMVGFTAGPEWTPVDVPLTEMANLDIQRVRNISISAAGSLGDFKLQVDDIEVR